MAGAALLPFEPRSVGLPVTCSQTHFYLSQSRDHGLPRIPTIHLEILRSEMEKNFAESHVESQV